MLHGGPMESARKEWITTDASRLAADWPALRTSEQVTLCNAGLGGRRYFNDKRRKPVLSSESGSESFQ